MLDTAMEQDQLLLVSCIAGGSGGLILLGSLTVSYAGASRQYP
jgi:hypothetical protein